MYGLRVRWIHNSGYDTVREFLMLRELPEPITEEELAAAGEESGNALEPLRSEGVDIEWVESEVMTDEDGRITGTFCHY